MVYLLLALALTLCTLAFVMLPLVRRSDRLHSEMAVPALTDPSLTWPVSRADLLMRRDALYAMLQDAQFDHRMGKLGDSDYQALRARAMREAASVLQQLDRLTPETEAAVDREIEQAVARMRAVAPDQRAQGLPRATVQAVEDELAGLIRHADAAAHAAGLACPNCGQAYRLGDAFCVHCGADLRSSGTGGQAR